MPDSSDKHEEQSFQMWLQASLLVVDDRLLRQIALAALGTDGNGAEESGITAYLLSFWLSGKLSASGLRLLVKS